MAVGRRVSAIHVPNPSRAFFGVRGRLLQGGTQRGSGGFVLDLVELGHQGVGQLRDPRQALDRLLGVELGHRTLARVSQLLPGRVDQGGHGLEAGGGASQSVGQRGEFAGEEPEQPVPEEVHERERIPALLLEGLLGERHGLRRADEDAVVDRLVAGQGGDVDGTQARQRVPGVGQSGGAPGIGQVRPLAVVVVESQVGGVDRVQPVVGGQQLIGQGGEFHRYLGRGTGAQSYPAAPVSSRPPP